MRKETDQMREKGEKISKETEQMRKETDQMREKTVQMCEKGAQMSKETEQMSEKTDQMRKKGSRPAINFLNMSNNRNIPRPLMGTTRNHDNKVIQDYKCGRETGQT